MGQDNEDEGNLQDFEADYSWRKQPLLSLLLSLLKLMQAARFASKCLALVHGTSVGTIFFHSSQGSWGHKEEWQMGAPDVAKGADEKKAETLAVFFKMI